MFEMLKRYNGKILIDDKEVSIDDIMSNSNLQNGHIRLCPSEGAKEKQSQSKVDSNIEYKVTVKQYMTEKSSIGFDFMTKWNNDNPMPLRTMVGVVEKETRGMFYMKLHGLAEPVVKCLRCNRVLTNPISKKYGIGPECIHKVPILVNLDINDVESITNKLQEVTWEGWIIKSAIVERKEV